jgi:hypothetical protein
LHSRIDHPNAEILVEMFLGDLLKRHECTAARIREKDIEPGFLLFDRREEPVKIGQVRDITPDARRVGAELLHSGVGVELWLTPPVMKTRAPSATNCCAVARPRPLLPPVINAIFPESFCDISIFRLIAPELSASPKVICELLF